MTLLSSRENTLTPSLVIFPTKSDKPTTFSFSSFFNDALSSLGIQRKENEDLEYNVKLQKIELKTKKIEKKTKGLKMLKACLCNGKEKKRT
jgi:hypothetical protein